MPLSKARMRARKAVDRAIAKGEPIPPDTAIATLPVEDRKAILAKIATTKINVGHLRPSHVLQAIDMLNKMENTYVPEYHSYTDNRQLNIYVNSDDGKAMLSTIMAGSRELQTSTDVLPTEQPVQTDTYNNEGSTEPEPASTDVYNNEAGQGENNRTSVLPASSEEGGVS